jgi:thiol:disulfide interchange protein DsbD
MPAFVFGLDNTDFKDRNPAARTRSKRQPKEDRMPLIRSAWALLALLMSLVVAAPARAADDFLDPAVAFQVSARALADKRVELTYRIAPGYYLYRERFKFDSGDAKLGEPQIPPGKKKYDTALEQNVEVYHDQVIVTLPVVSAPKTFTISATHQGCAEKGLCYPPQPRAIHVALKAFGADADSAQVVLPDDAAAATGAPAPAAILPADTPPAMSVAPGATAGTSLRASILGGAAANPGAVAPTAGASGSAAPDAATMAAEAPAARNGAAAAPASDDRRIGAALAGGHLLAIISIAFALGLGLSLTPCVWPMLPILSSIIVGQGKQVTPARGLALSATYSLGMALVYTLLGVAAGLIGQGFAGFLQSPPVLVAFGVLLVVLSLSMFGFYELQLPAAWRDRLSARNEKLSGGQLGGVFGMGVLSALIVSPCVSAPLVGALVYIGESRDAALGGLALFAIAAGMSVPLLIVGTSAGTLLPRSGPWMERVKQVFGLVLLGVAIYIVQPVLPGLAAMVAWGTLLVLGAASLGAFEPVHPGPHHGAARLMKGFGLLLALLGVLQFVGLAAGGRDPAQPLSPFTLAHVEATGAKGAAGGALVAGEPRFDRVASVSELEQRLQAAGRPVMLDFYADWCVSCKEMEKETFVDPAVKAKLANAVLLRADVTANTPDDRALLKRFNLYGPPGLIFFDKQGRELENVRVVGFQDGDRFATTLAGAGL